MCAVSEVDWFRFEPDGRESQYGAWMHQKIGNECRWKLTELLDAVFTLETLALLDTLGALVKVVLEWSAGFRLFAVCRGEDHCNV